MLDYIEALRLRSLHTTMRKMELSLKSHHLSVYFTVVTSTGYLIKKDGVLKQGLSIIMGL